ncbi:hypothetical protein FRC02_009211 [Tulasnella sp. 418]|nr:hypothetical protein FRC02_009211 [Tulasnella sp. 418]
MSFRREPIKPSASQTNKSFVPSADNRGSSRSATEQRAALRPVTNPNSISSRDSNTSLATTSPNLAQTHNSSLGTMDRIKEVSSLLLSRFYLTPQCHLSFIGISLLNPLTQRRHPHRVNIHLHALISLLLTSETCTLAC